MKIRLIAMDLDGTLLGRDKRISPRNREALLRCQERGIMPVLASGRSFESVRELALETGLHSPIISSNGARIDRSPEGDTILDDTFPLEDSKRVYTVMKDSGVYFVCYGHGKLFQNNLDGYGEGRGINQLQKKGPSENDGYILEVVRDEERMLKEGLIAPYKYVAFSPDAERLEAVKNALIEQHIPCEISSSWFDNIEVLTLGAGKGKALDVLRREYGIAREETMAFGDNLNDKQMLLAAGVPVAMENAVPEIKAIAAIIAPHHDESGVGRVIEEKVLDQAEE